VKNWSQCLRIIGIIMVVIGLINLITNLILVAKAKSLLHVQFYDNQDNYVDYTFNPKGLYFSGLEKIISGLFSIYLGRLLSSKYAPIVREYKKTLAGETTGISNSPKKSEVMQGMRKSVKRVMCIQAIVVLVLLVLFDKWAIQQSENFLNFYYDDVLSHNNSSVNASSLTPSTNSSNNSTSNYTFNHSESVNVTQSFSLLEKFNSFVQNQTNYYDAWQPYLDLLQFISEKPKSEAIPFVKKYIHE
jgi:Na+/melibiose symporter-like transporter